jgi:putative two-component system response regulator
MSSSHADRLETVLRESSNPAEPEVRLALLRLTSEVKERLAQGSSGAKEFFLSALRSLARMKGNGHAELRLHCIFDCGHYFFLAGQPPQTEESARLMIELASRTDHQLWVRKAHTLLGLTYADCGRVADAVVHYSAAIEIARRTAEREGEVNVWLNLGIALNYAGLFREAIPCFARAVELAQNIPNFRALAAHAYCNIAQSHLYLDEFKLGRAAIDKSLTMSSEPTCADEAESRTTREFTKVQLCLEMKEYKSALHHSNLCTKFAMWGNSPRSQVMARIARGLCSVWAGDVEAGIKELNVALEEAATLASSKADALVALVKAYDEIGDSQRALENLRALMSHICDSRQRSIAALLTIPTGDDIAGWSDSDSSSLVAFEHREALLRAKVAESEVITSRFEMLERLAVTADLREEASGEHGYRVGKLASLLAGDIGLDREICVTIDIAARLHDIGKIGIPDRILLNSQELKDAERHFMSAHTLIGSEMLGKSNIPQLKMAEEIARCHHEWWNGTGYPAKKSGKRIPISARIVALADVFDALTHGRPYEQPWTIDRAIDQIRSLSGEQFDPELTDRFLALIDRLRKDHADLDGFLGKAGRNSPFLQARNKIRDMLTKERDQEREAAAVKGNETRH